MRLGLYTFVTLVLVGTVGAFTYTIDSHYYVIELMGINFNLPIALWIILPMIILFIFTVIHMFFYGLKNYFLFKKWKKDIRTLEDALYWSLVNEPQKQKFIIGDIANIANILGKSSLDVSDNVEGLSPRLARVVNIIQKIKKGEYIDLKEEKMSKVFNKGNPILIQNRLNRMTSDEKFSEDVMKASSEYSLPVRVQALSIFAGKENFTTAKKYAKVFDVENFLIMINRMSSENTLELTPEILEYFVKILDLSCRDFIEVVLVTKKYFKPEENLKLFKSLQDKNDKVKNAYLYLLFEYELLEQASRYLDESEEKDFIKFKAFYELKNLHSKYRLEDIVDIHSICISTREY